MEKKPTKKEQLTLVNNVLKLSTKLLKVRRIHDTLTTVTSSFFSEATPGTGRCRADGG